MQPRKPTIFDELEVSAPTPKSRPGCDKVLSAIRCGDPVLGESLPALKRATGIDYAELQLVIYELEFDQLAIFSRDTPDGFARYFPKERERSRPVPKAEDWRRSSPSTRSAPQVLTHVPAASAAPVVVAEAVPKISACAPEPDPVSIKPKKPRKECNWNYEFDDRICAYEPCSRIFLARIRKDGTADHCSRACHLRDLSRQRVKVPHDYDLLYRLYVIENKTTTEIAELFGCEHHAVGHRLLDVGIRPRKVGISRWTHCCEEGCDKPVHKIQHKGNGSWYGKRCFEHWKKFRAKVNKDYIDKTPAARQHRNAYMKRYHRKSRAKTPITANALTVAVGVCV